MFCRTVTQIVNKRNEKENEVDDKTYQRPNYFFNKEGKKEIKPLRHNDIPSLREYENKKRF